MGIGEVKTMNDIIYIYNPMFAPSWLISEMDKSINNFHNKLQDMKKMDRGGGDFTKPLAEGTMISNIKPLGGFKKAPPPKPIKKTIMKNTEFKHELGIEASDIVTGFKGIITGRVQHLTGCNTYGLKPKVDTEGKISPDEWFDETRIRIKKNAKIVNIVSAAEDDFDKLSGGPQDNPKPVN